MHIGKLTLDEKRPVIMGILNVTPDSFSDGGRYTAVSAAVDHALELIEDGADIIDIGGESSRPGASPVSTAEELGRVLPVIEALHRESDVVISIDTCKAEVARGSLEAGAAIVNDITALEGDGGMTSVIAEAECPVILMHMRGEPRTMQKNPAYTDVVGEVYAYLESRIVFAESHGIPRSRIIVDPGIGFGKTLAHNLALLRHIARFRETGCPVLVGASRKSMIGMITGAKVNDRTWGTAAITAHCVREGVGIHRVHDVREMREVIDITTSILHDGIGPEN